MKGDFTRRTFRPEKHYSSVRMQQGRMQLDADWNEQAEIQQYLARSQTRDLIGPSGVPAETPSGFAIQVRDGTLFIGPGHFYVSGILCENDQERRYHEQPDYPVAPLNINTALAAGGMLAYLDVWERHISGLEDADLIEVALGGADTATRSRVVCQVKLTPAARPEDAMSLNLNTVTGRNDTRAGLSVRLDGDGPPAGNYLYRLEIHQRSANGPTLKWSRENGSVVAEWLGGRNPIEVRGRTRFAVNQIVELTDDTHELTGQPGVLRRIQSIDESGGTQRLTLEDTGNNLGALIDTFRDDNRSRKRKVRLWESDELRFTPGTEFPLPGSGLLVTFNAANYESGDAWVIPVRQRTAAPPVRADGEHFFARLAHLAVPAAGQQAPVTDLRRRFATIPDLQQQIDNLRINAVPEGVIVMWSGTADQIPRYWRLCDGTNNTPDLRSRFVLGAGAAAPYRLKDARGGSETHTHELDVAAALPAGTSLTTADEPGHIHSFFSWQTNINPGTNVSLSSSNVAISPAGNSNNPRSVNGPIYQIDTQVNQPHRHTFTIPRVQTGTNTIRVAGQPPEVGLPPWYALCFIMRVGFP